jgi:hypothetical protein
MENLKHKKEDTIALKICTLVTLVLFLSSVLVILYRKQKILTVLLSSFSAHASENASAQWYIFNAYIFIH